MDAEAYIEDNKTIIKEIEKKFDLEELKKVINDMSLVAWGNRMERPHLNRWLKNFDGRILKNENVEKIIALWLLMNFTFYTEREVRALCKCIFNDFIHAKLIKYEDTGFMKSNTISEQVQYIIDNTLFQPLGNPSESGTSILYFFRQENNLSTESFEKKDCKKYENIVYIDDVIITGKQADWYINEKAHIDGEKYLLTFIATEMAVDYLKKKQSEYSLIHSILLDERSQTFVDDSFVFSGIDILEMRNLAVKLCQEYGYIIFDEWPLGFEDGQYLFGLYYNTPDNTLPIIWSNHESWTPAFPRYNKKYKESGFEIDDSKYF